MSGERLTDHQNGGLEKRTWILVAVICAILLGVSAIMFVPVKKAVDETLPAMMVEQESAEIHSTTLTLRNVGIFMPVVGYTLCCTDSGSFTLSCLQILSLTVLICSFHTSLLFLSVYKL